MKIEFTAFPRGLHGTGPARRMRRTGKVPGVVYGGDGKPQSIEVDHKALLRHLKMEAFHASILDMKVDGQGQQVLLRDFQMHPFRDEVLHVDFQRVSKDRKIHMRVPLHFINQETCPGVKTGGGIVSHVMTEVDVSCLPADLPEYIEVDMGKMDLGAILHLADLSLPKGVEVVTKLRKENPVIATVQVPKQPSAEEEAAATEAPTTEIITEKAGAEGEKKDEKKEPAKKG